MKLAPPDDPAYGFMMKCVPKAKTVMFICLPEQISFSVFIMDESTHTFIFAGCRADSELAPVRNVRRRVHIVRGGSIP